MPDLVSTAGSASANSFLEVDAADTYIDTKLNAGAWNDDASDDDKTRALISASRWLSDLEWCGSRVDSTQALSWPRQFAPNPDDPNEFYFSETVIPQRVKDAACELALELLKAGTTDLLVLDSTANVIEETVGPITTRYAEPGQKPISVLQKFPQVIKKIRPLLADTLSSNQMRVVRG